MQPNTLNEPVSKSPTRWMLLGLIGALLIFQVALYWRSFEVKMAFDDFIFVDEIPRGDLYGPGVFFRQSKSYLHYRPFTSVVFWGIAHHFPQTWEFWLRAADFVCDAGYALVLALWIRELRLSLLASAIAVSLMLFHPVLPQALGSIDGMDSLSSSALLWLGAWCALRWRDRPAVAAVAVVSCFFLAAGWKEYAFAMIPLAPWTVFCFSEKRRWRNALIVFAALMVAFVVMLLIRHYTIPPGFGAGTGYASISPVQWVKNAGIIGTGLLFFGNSIWVFVHQGIPAFALVLASMALAAVVIAGGIVSQLRSANTAADQNALLDLRRWILFLVGSFAAASFPVNVMNHVSEMYLPPLLLPLALLCGISAQGWSRCSQRTRWAVSAVALVALISSCWTVYDKVAGLREVGLRAERQLYQILALLPPDAHDLKIGLVFDTAELPPRRTYAVYRAGDEMLIAQPMSMNRVAPGRGLKIETFVKGPPSESDAIDVVLKWNAAKQDFIRER